MDWTENILNRRKHISNARFTLSADNRLKGISWKVPGGSLLGEDENVPFVYIIKVI